MSDDRIEGQSGDEKKNWIVTLRDRWVETLIATLIGLSITAPLFYFWGEITEGVRLWNTERQTISHDEALAEARESLGAQTVDAIPFRNLDSSQHYIRCCA